MITLVMMMMVEVEETFLDKTPFLLFLQNSQIAVLRNGLMNTVLIAEFFNLDVG